MRQINLWEEKRATWQGYQADKSIGYRTISPHGDNTHLPTKQEVLGSIPVRTTPFFW
jgi:hypothetical protein